MSRRRKRKEPTLTEQLEAVAAMLVARGVTREEFNDVLFVIGLRIFRQGIGLGWSEANQIVDLAYLEAEIDALD